SRRYPQAAALVPPATLPLTREASKPANRIVFASQAPTPNPASTRSVRSRGHVTCPLLRLGGMQRRRLRAISRELVVRAEHLAMPILEQRAVPAVRVEEGIAEPELPRDVAQGELVSPAALMYFTPPLLAELPDRLAVAPQQHAVGRQPRMSGVAIQR